MTSLHESKYAIPLISAIIERKGERETEILIQTRISGYDDLYQGTIEIPAGMIFVQSKNGISHSPEEHTEMRHIATAARILVTALTEAQNT